MIPWVVGDDMGSDGLVRKLLSCSQVKSWVKKLTWLLIGSLFFILLITSAIPDRALSLTKLLICVRHIFDNR